MTRLRFSTDAVPAAQQFAYWRESICRAFAALDPVPDVPADQAFTSLVEVDTLPGASLSLVQSQAQRVARAAAQIRIDPREQLFVNLLLQGSGQVEQDGHRSPVSAGDIYVVDTARPYLLQHAGPFRLLCLSLPRQALEGSGRVGLAFAQPRSSRDGDARLAVGLLRQLRQAVGPERVGANSNHAHHGAAISSACSAEALAIITCWLGRVLAAPGQTPTRPSLASHDLWLRARHLIELNLRDSTLSPQTLAAELKVSLRYLHKAFAAEGATVATTVRTLRLQRAALALRQHAGRRTIAAIAADWGFDDAPHFTRLFRQQFGHTPSTHRHQHERDCDAAPPT
jgi:AraC family transcriptional regulator, positive regulator of tynA and feaB